MDQKKRRVKNVLTSQHKYHAGLAAPELGRRKACRRKKHRTQEKQHSVLASPRRWGVEERKNKFRRENLPVGEALYRGGKGLVLF